MADAMRAMLDELMGKERNVPLDQRKGTDIRFNDPEVCKYALAGLCPYGLFKNTKSDLGNCKYTVHEDDVQWDAAKDVWDGLPPREKDRYGYDRELTTLLTTLVRDMNRKIERQKERAVIESSAKPVSIDDKARLDAIKAQEADAAKRSQAMAEAGDVDGSMVCAQQAEAYKLQHDTLHTQLTAPERVMTVCEVCGVFINSTDNDQRRQDHLTGKQYMGWKAIRDKLTEMQEKQASQRLPPPPGRPEEARSAPREPHRDRESREPRESRRDRDRSDRPHSSRDPHQERHSDRHRDDRHRERENGKRSSSHSHHDRHRSRSLERRRERDHTLEAQNPRGSRR